MSDRTLVSAAQVVEMHGARSGGITGALIVAVVPSAPFPIVADVGAADAVWDALEKLVEKRKARLAGQ